MHYVQRKNAIFLWFIICLFIGCFNLPHVDWSVSDELAQEYFVDLVLFNSVAYKKT